jgi:DNA primase
VSLFPQDFIDDLKSQTDIVSVVGEVVSLKKTGGTYKGLCPFHQEKTPSFNVNKDKGFFKCFGCGAGGDVVKFVELHQKLPFPEAVRYLAQRAGIQIPEREGGPEDRALVGEREALVKLHEIAAAFFKTMLASPAGARARKEIESRGLTPETAQTFGYGYAPAGGRDTLRALFEGERIAKDLQIKSGLVMETDDGRVADRFRHRLMIPIARDTGSIVAFGGRALDEGQIPKYLNSRETPIYTKGRTLYGLDVTKGAIRKHNYCVLVEGYFDLSQVWQAGVQPVVALCGTALTSSQARLLKRFTSKVVLSLDPDAAGQGAAARSSELLVAEGFQVNVALLPEGADPDVFIRKQGARAYADRLKGSQPYLEFLLDRAAERLDVNRPESRKAFLDEMLKVAATIPDAMARDQFADRLAHKARVTEAVIRDEIRKAAAQRRPEAPAMAVPPTARVRPAEQGLLWALAHRPVEGLAGVAQLEAADLEGLVAEPVFALAASLTDVPPNVLPELLRERLSDGERALLERAALHEAPMASAADCVGALKLDRYRRELALVQDEIEQQQDRQTGTHGPRETAGEADATLRALWERKMILVRKIESLKA